MAWFKVDDGLHSSRKLLSIPKRTRWAALGVWSFAGSWSSDQLTDGFIPDYMLAEWGTPPAAPEALVEAGLWERTSGGYVFHNWHEYQPRKEDVDAERAKARERMRELRARRNQPKPQEDGEEESVFGRTALNGSDEVRNPDPTRPDPFSSSKEEEGRPEVEMLCDKLADAVAANGVKRPTKTKAARDAARLLLDKDGYTLDQVLWMINWATTHEFWRSNILSMAKLRDKFDQMKLQALDSKHRPAAGTFGGPVDVEAVLGKDYWTVPEAPAHMSISEGLAWKKAQRAAHDQEREQLARKKVETLAA